MTTTGTLKPCPFWRSLKDDPPQFTQPRMLICKGKPLARKLGDFVAEDGTTYTENVVRPEKLDWLVNDLVAIGFSEWMVVPE